MERLVTYLMQSRGFDVTHAVDGPTGLAMAEQLEPAIVLLDIKLPGMDGYTLLREWKSDPALTQIPFIVYTATCTDPKDEKLAMHLGADAFIVKPAEPELFMRRVQSVIAQSRTDAATPRQAALQR